MVILPSVQSKAAPPPSPPGPPTFQVWAAFLRSFRNLRELTPSPPPVYLFGSSEKGAVAGPGGGAGVEFAAALDTLSAKALWSMPQMRRASKAQQSWLR